MCPARRGPILAPAAPPRTTRRCTQRKEARALMAAPESAPPAEAALQLTLLHRGATVTALLSDGRMLARLDAAEVPARVLAALLGELRSLPPRPGGRRAGHDDGAGGAGDDSGGADASGEEPVRTLGRRIFDELLPAAASEHLRRAAAGAITLLLEPPLAQVPWELGYDGERFLGERWPLARRVVTGEAAPPPAPALAARWGPLAVHVCRVGESPAGTAGAAGADDSSAAAAEDALLARLGAATHLVLSSSATAAVPALPAVAARAGTAHDVVHFLARRAGAVGSLAAMQTLAAPPALLVCQGMHGAFDIDLDFAAEAARRGCTALCLASHPQAPGAAADFVLAIYRSLAQGVPLAEAVRAARSELLRQSGAAALAGVTAQVYGDGGLVVKPPPQPSAGEDNLRQVTILSFDLVGSTRLIAELGAERYSEVLAAYHRLCASVLGRHGGAADNPQGDDGFMCYFGLHAAREDAAAQAVQAAVEVLDAVAALGVAVRIGGCTGEVVVRDGLPFGAAVHFAARLQSIAAPGTLVVAESTMKLLKGRYRFEALEHVPELKGFEQRPGAAQEALYRVVGAAAPGADSVSAGLPAAPPFVGRGDEMRALHAHWAAAKAGRLRLVRVVGEAGIGKSRLLREFKRALAAQGHETLECRCAAEHANSALQPMIEALRHELRLGTDSAPAQVAGAPAAAAQALAGDHAALRRLTAALRAPEEGAALLAALLGLPPPAGHTLDALPPERRRELTLALLVELAKARARTGAACMIVEDVHWIDPTTRELIDRLAAEAAGVPLLVLLSTRTDAERPWRPAGQVHDEELKGLPEEAARRLVLGVGGEAALPGEVVHLLAARTDGVPLFIEESTRMAIELGAEMAGDSTALLRQVPSTLLDLLTARLDRLGGAKPVAQICGAIGREFPLALVRAVLAHPGSPFHQRELAEPLAALTRAGMLVRRGEGDERYRFKHALIRDAAYRSLLERDRRRLHGVVAAVLGEQFAALAQAQPEWLAFHFTEAGQFAQALRAWEAAARLAASRSAHVEAINHLAAALAALARAPEDPERQRAELRLQLLLATRLIATEGYGAERVERVYARAMELAAALADAPAQMKVLLGLEAYHSARAEFDKALAIAADARRRSAAGPGAAAGAGAGADAGTEAIHRIQLQWAVANVVMHQGDMAAAVVQMDECLAAYDRLEHRSTVVQDPGVMCLCYSAWAMWQLGFPDQAMQRVSTVVERARRLKHEFSLGQAFGFLAAIHLFRGEHDSALAAAERAIDICERGGFAMWLSLARLIRGRVLAEAGAAESGIEEMRVAHEAWRRTGTVLTTPFYLALRAEGLALGGRAGEGLTLLDEALAVIERCGERYYEAEVRRLRGVLLLQSAAGEATAAAAAARLAAARAEAESWLQGALASAQARQLHSLALRAATSLAELWRSSQRAAEGAPLLDTALRAVAEGSHTRDVLRARSLRDEMAATAAGAAAAPG